MCWIKTVTKLSVASHKIHLFLTYSTYPNAGCEDGGSHDEVEKQFAAELDQLPYNNGRLSIRGGRKIGQRVCRNV